MDVGKISRALGWFSIGLGAAELLAGRRIGKALGTEQVGVIRGFGVREIAAGVGLLDAPRHNVRMWNRVAGDAIDLGALGLLLAKSPKKNMVYGAIAFVIGATVVDTLVASALSKSPDPNMGRLPQAA